MASLVEDGKFDLSTHWVVAARDVGGLDAEAVRQAEADLMQDVELTRWLQSALRGRNLYVHHHGFTRHGGVLELRARLTEDGPAAVPVRSESGRLEMRPVPEVSKAGG